MAEGNLLYCLCHGYFLRNFVLEDACWGLLLEKVFTSKRGLIFLSKSLLLWARCEGGEWDLIKWVTTMRVAVSNAPKQARERQFSGRHWAQSLIFRKQATPYYPCLGCAHRYEGAEVGKILANFC